MKLQDRCALVTGASRGIGRAIALELAMQGADIGISYQNSQAEAEKVCQEIEKLGRKAMAFCGSVAKEGDVQAMFTSFFEAYPQLDILVCNAGITRDAPFGRMTSDNFQEVIQTNLVGTFYCLREASRPMLRQKYGRVVTISSTAGLAGNVGQANYSASKAGIIGLTKSFALEHARRDITANIVSPGLIESSMSEGLSEKNKEKILSMIPKRRLGLAEEVANMVSFLVSEDSGYITGQIFSIDGGLKT